eukprot:TRINITY_DN1798_c4_g1_i1.p1 TRINITY_DN1798_c4_g1~~TRINITY_DN1798_c4_g1_i1.p1  ORF type:complete len:616 (+),score=199.51 TRINITY_DN1798_c4_g1_i1:64-1911(+)
MPNKPENLPGLNTQALQDSALNDKKTMRNIQIVFSLGHVMNDLCAAMWFTYMLAFFEKVAGLGGVYSGSLMLLGQLVDGCATPLVGIGCDRSASKADKTKDGEAVAFRLPWHLMGCCMVAISFPWLFIRDTQFAFDSGATSSDSASGNGKVWAWYGIWVAVFQIGWATTQISHLSLIPDLSAGCNTRRCSLNASRYAATVLSTVAVYCAAWGLLGSSTTGGKHHDASPAPASEGPTHATNYDLMLTSVAHWFHSADRDALLGDSEDQDGGLTQDNKGSFLILAIGIACLGVTFSCAFHIFMRVFTRTSGKYLVNPESPKAGLDAGTMQVMRMWFSSGKFWIIGTLYMCTRIIINITQTFLALYVLTSLRAETVAIATVPLVLYVASLIGTYVVTPVNEKLGPYFTYMLAVLCIAGACITFYFTPSHTDLKVSHPANATLLGTSDDEAENKGQWLVYVAAAVFGLFSSLLMVANTTMVASTIGDLPGSAIVYGMYSLTDKMSCGVIIMLFQSLKPDLPDGVKEGTAQWVDVEKDLDHYYRMCVGLFPCAVGAVALLGVLGARVTKNPPTWEEYQAHRNKGKQADEKTKLSIAAPTSYAVADADAEQPKADAVNEEY